jgi:hypothetical protein
MYYIYLKVFKNTSISSIVQIPQTTPPIVLKKAVCIKINVFKLRTIFSRSPLTMAWHGMSLGYRWCRWPPNMKGNCEYTE